MGSTLTHMTPLPIAGGRSKINWIIIARSWLGVDGQAACFTRSRLKRIFQQYFVVIFASRAFRFLSGFFVEGGGEMVGVSVSLLEELVSIIMSTRANDFKNAV